jgi:hypothetical protein
MARAITASARWRRRRESPKAPRHYQFVARGIAEALAAVGAGATYMQASRVARDRARRFRFDLETGEVRESDHGQLVADWIELFAPVVFERQRQSAWPAAGSLLLDHLPFRVRALDDDGKRIPAGRVAFDVFCAVGYRAGRPRLWHAEAFASAHPTNWSAFLGALPGEPRRSSATPTAACCGRSRGAGRAPSCTSASGTCSTRLSAFWPRKREAVPARGWRNFGLAPRGHSPVPRSGGRSSGRLGRPRTRASIAGSPSMARRSNRSSPAARLRLGAPSTCR